MLNKCVRTLTNSHMCFLPSPKDLFFNQQQKRETCRTEHSAEIKINVRLVSARTEEGRDRCLVHAAYLAILQPMNDTVYKLAQFDEVKLSWKIYMPR